MKPTNTQKAEILVEALPYILKYKGKIIVVRYDAVEEHLKPAFIQDVLMLSQVGIKVVIVQGKGANCNETDLLSVAKEGYLLVNSICIGNGNALGINGVDCKLCQIEMGNVVSVNASVVDVALTNGAIPVISALGVDGGEPKALNADVLAAKIASALGAAAFINMNEGKGIIVDGKLISSLNVSEVPMLIKTGIVQGVLSNKVNSCLEAIRRGVAAAFLIDGRIPHSILIETLSNEGIGTMFN